MPVRDNNKLLERGREALERRLPRGWSAEIANRFSEVDARIRIVAPDQTRVSVAVEARPKLDPRQAVELARTFKGSEPSLVVAPYLSRSTRERLVEAGINYLDLTGNVKVVLSRPGLFIDTGGADVDPHAVPRPARTMRGSKAGRVVRVLIDQRAPGGVRDIALRAGVDPGYVSRILSLLDREAVIERKGRGKLTRVDWPRLLRRWAEDAPLESRGAQYACLDPRGTSTLLERISQLDRGSSIDPISVTDGGYQPRYAVTGSFVASQFAPVSPSRLITIYVTQVDRAIAELGLRRAEIGANVILIEPEDDGIFTGATLQANVRCVALSQAAADLLGSPGRGPAEGEALIEWMKDHEEAWRG